VHDDPSTTGEPGTSIEERDTRAARRAARAVVGGYHAAQLAELIEHVREALIRYDAGEIDAFELDEVIHHYKRATQELWKFCVGGGSHVLFAAGTLAYWDAEGERPDWWAAGAPRRRR
jgi:hypothetical protein